LKKPAKTGEYRVLNQYDEVYEITELAEHVLKSGKKLGLRVKIKHVKNPRVEKEEHYFKVEHEKLKRLGFKPTRKISETLDIMLKDLIKYKKRIFDKKSVILPKTKWR